ncbi:MAG: sodium:proton antiporter [Gammaproteobacteria bacterium]|nr:MAG: sodium:proton antiporter [Gammaproteobacteria bacterium]
MPKYINNYNQIALIIFILSLLAAFFVTNNVEKQWQEQSYVYQVYKNKAGVNAYLYQGQEQTIAHVVAYENSPLNQTNLNKLVGEPKLKEQWVYRTNGNKGSELELLKPGFHFGVWSLLPAFVAILLCLLSKEPITALFGGIVVGAFMLGRFDITDQVLVPSLATDSAAALLLLYLWLLGGLIGIWSKTGAAFAFADKMTQHFVKGQRSAKVVTWLLGIIFFQGGTVSTVLVGTTVRPFADKAKVSHEEMSYIVDSTASPIALILAFNAWPIYVQALIFVPGATFLATESDRLAFFFASIPLSFYSILAVIGTLLLSLNITKFSGKGIRKAHQRVLTTGELDAPNARPLSAPELQKCSVPKGYSPHFLEFVLPLLSLIVIAISSFIAFGSPKVNWAFGSALMLSVIIALIKGMSLNDLLDGFSQGLKGVVVASVILMLAITIGSISKEVGGGLYLVDLVGKSLPFWLLPITLQIITMTIAFSTGTSWGTYAIAFPLAMPLAWTIAQTQGLENPEFFMMVCFATVLNGSIFGDQCSPISDTTILSSMTTGCDLMDHVKTQLFPAILTASIAGVLWTLTVLIGA